MKTPVCCLIASGLMVLPAVSSTTVLAGSAGLIHGLSEVDLTGEMVYAINFSANDGPRVVNGVTFTPDTALPPGVTTVGPNNVTPWQTKPNFGSTPDDDAFEGIFEDIRWANSTTASPNLEAHLDVTPGDLYKLQVLFYENKAGNRRWDIQVEGTTSVDEITSNGPTDAGGAVPGYQSNAAVLFSQVLVAGDTTLDVVMGNLDGANDAGDRNPIWQGLTLERLGADTDADLLPDAWETAAFGNLSQNGAGDQDTDGLTNAAEFNLGTDAADNDSDNDGLLDGAEVNTHLTNPKAADSDGDGLSDGAEVNVRLTNPLLADSDNDGLSDGAEVNTHGTNPLDADSDDDDYPDGVEIANATNPTNSALFPTLASFGRVITGGGAGEGLDLTGNFKYAFNVGTNGAPGLIRGVDFTAETAAGITISPSAEIAAWGALPEFGPDADDDALEWMLHSIRHAGANGGDITVTLTGLTPGRPHKLQLLFLERCCTRGCDILVDGVLKLDEFAPYTYQDSTASPTRAGCAVIGFFTSGSTATIRLTGATVTTPAYTDRNPILNGLTLEELGGADADADGLDDLWETANFGNLGQTGTGDPDTDGLNNAGEFARATNPNDSDSDDDTLLDGAEVNTHMTDPKSADTDGDSLSDAFEVLTSLTNPLLADSDGDGYTDPAELSQGTSATNAAQYPLFASVASSFTGGDPGEGLDLAGTFLSAFNVGTNGAAPGAVQDVTFNDDTAGGVVVTAVNEVGAWHAPTYGDTTNDDNLEHVMKSIRWNSAPGPVEVSVPGLTPGRAYKLQLLFAEQCCAGRAFDVEVEGLHRLDEFNPATVHLGAGNTRRGAVATIGFVAGDDTLNIALNGQSVYTPSNIDHNPILSGVTLEELTLPDTDSDGLPDAWEQQFFGSLAPTAGGNSDNDGRTNAQEYLAGTLPDDPDSDNDGVTDGAESGLGTNPLVADTDGDDLPDGAESTAGTNPLIADTDGDTYPDAAELIGGSDPLVALSTPAQAIVGTFTGGDAGEGLDLDGTFLYAFNFGTPGAKGQARDAHFSADNAPGIGYSALNEIPNWHAPDYGNTAADDVLEGVMQSIRWAGAPDTVRLQLAGTVPGKRYKLQLLFAETGPNRGFDVLVEGGVVADDFFPGVVMGNTNTQGAMVSYEFTARDTLLKIELLGAGTPGAPDKNPILSGLTLEALPDSVPVGATLQVVSISPAGVSFTATGTAAKVYALDYSPDLLTGTWVEVDDNVQMNGAGTATTTDTVPGHRTPGRGFWRLRDPVLKPAP